MSSGNFFDQDLSAKVFAVGQKALDATLKMSELNTNALKSVVDRQMELGSAVAEFGGAQVRSLGLVSDPAEFLQSQKDNAETLRGQFEACATALKDLAGETQKAYVEFASGLAAELGMAPA